MQRDIGVFCRTCLQCMCTTGGHTIPRPLRDTLHADKPNQILHFDYFHVRKPSEDTPDEAQYVLVLMDGFSRFVLLTPFADATADNTVTAIMHWISLFGVPKTFISDQGSHFQNQVVGRLSQRLTIQHHFTTVYAPWANGQVERVNREIKRLLGAIRSSNKLQPDAWVELLPLVNHILNNTATPVLGNIAPRQAFTGLPPTSPLDAIYKPDAKDFKTVKLDAPEVTKAVDELQKQLYAIHERVIATAPRSKRPRTGESPVDFVQGDYVLYRDHTARDKDKTAMPWQGPARVEAKVNDNSYTVRNLASDTSKTLHASFLKYYADSSLHVTPQLTEFAAHGGAVAAIENIIGHRTHNRQRQLLVHWEGYPKAEATWEPFNIICKDSSIYVRKYVRALPDTDPAKADMLKLCKEKK